MKRSPEFGGAVAHLRSPCEGCGERQPDFDCAAGCRLRQDFLDQQNRDTRFDVEMKTMETQKTVGIPSERLSAPPATKPITAGILKTLARMLKQQGTTSIPRADLALELGRSSSTLAYHLNGLAAKGLIIIIPGTGVTGAVRVALPHPAAAEEKTIVTEKAPLPLEFQRVKPGFCAEHPEEDRVVLAKKPALGGKIPAGCWSCAHGESSLAADPLPKKPPGEPGEAQAVELPGVAGLSLCRVEGCNAFSRIDSLGRDMHLCKKHLAQRGRGNLSLGSAASHTPFYLPLHDPKYAELKKWLEATAKEFEQDLSRAVMYRLKKAWELSGGAV